MIEVNEETRAAAVELAEELLGTCQSVSVDQLKEYFGENAPDSLIDLPIALLALIDEVTIECSGCGWWCEMHEINDQGLCNDCQEDEEFDDD